MVDGAGSDFVSAVILGTGALVAFDTVVAMVYHSDIVSPTNFRSPYFGEISACTHWVGIQLAIGDFDRGDCPVYCMRLGGRIIF